MITQEIKYTSAYPLTHFKVRTSAVQKNLWLDAHDLKLELEPRLQWQYNTIFFPIMAHAHVFIYTHTNIENGVG